MEISFGKGLRGGGLKLVFDTLFDRIRSHFTLLFASFYLALCMETDAFSEAGTYEHNNIHVRFKKN